MNLQEKIDKYLGESTYEWKGPIFINNGKKIGLGAGTSDGHVNALTYIQWKKLNVPEKIGTYYSNRTLGDTLIEALLMKLQFNKRVDFNMWSKTKNPTFEEKLDWIIKSGVKLTSKGIDYNR